MYHQNVIDLTTVYLFTINKICMNIDALRPLLSLLTDSRVLGAKKRGVYRNADAGCTCFTK